VVLAGIVVAVRQRRMAELDVRVAKRFGRSRERFEQRLQLGQPARLRVGDRRLEPRRNVFPHQNVSVPRTLIGIMRTLCDTGVSNRLTEYVNERSTPSGPDVT